MNRTLEVRYEYLPPEPVTLTIGDVSFRVDGALAIFYRMAKYMGQVELYMKEMQPYYWKHYQAALRLKQAEAEREQLYRELDAERKRAKEAEKSRIKRLRKKIDTVLADGAGCSSDEHEIISQGDYTTNDHG